MIITIGGPKESGFHPITIDQSKLYFLNPNGVQSESLSKLNEVIPMKEIKERAPEHINWKQKEITGSAVLAVLEGLDGTNNKRKSYEFMDMIQCHPHSLSPQEQEVIAEKALEQLVKYREAFKIDQNIYIEFGIQDILNGLVSLQNDQITKLAIEECSKCPSILVAGTVERLQHT